MPKYEDNETKLRTKAKPAWTLFFTYLCVIVIGSMLGYAIWGEGNQLPMMIFMDLMLLTTTIVFLCGYWSSVKPMFATLGVLNTQSWLGLLLLAPLLAINYGYHHMLIELMGQKTTEDPYSFFSSPWGPIILICVMPAIVEEIGFRGIIQDQFERVVSPWVAIIVASAAFSAAHFSVLSAPYLALVGVLLGWMKWKTGSLYPSMVVHFLHNYAVVTHF